MNRLKVYLDTSIINFLYANDSPDYKKTTEYFFDNIIQNNVVDAYISPVVIKEIHNTPDSVHKSVLLSTLDNYSSIKMLVTNTATENDVIFLSEQYIKNGIIPSKNPSDSLHIAYATVFQMDVLLSWNFRHLANINKEQKILMLNNTLGYHYPFRLLNPLEVYFD